MNNEEISREFAKLSTAIVADACLRLGVQLQIPLPGVVPLFPGLKAAGRILPLRHFGSVDVFLEAMEKADKGDVLVIDNDGRMDEGCIGDLTVLEAQLSGLGGIIINGCHRDTAELVKIGFPVFSYGSFPAGPLRSGRRHPGAQQLTKFAKFVQYRQDFVLADDDGVMFIPDSRSHEIIKTANEIYTTERQQVEKIKAGISLREQLKFDEYLKEREKDFEYTFRKHLRKLGGAIEE